MELSKEQLIYLIERLIYSQNLISEVCVEESKLHIESDEAVDKIHECIYDMPSLYNATDLKAFIDLKECCVMQNMVISHVNRQN